VQESKPAKNLQIRKKSTNLQKILKSTKMQIHLETRVPALRF
jgi:hypothetical protein